jgi:AcrR family transcriptional regulator
MPGIDLDRLRVRPPGEEMFQFMQSVLDSFYYRFGCVIVKGYFTCQTVHSSESMMPSRDTTGRKKPTSEAIRLDTKLHPRQGRGQDTYEIVLTTAGNMLRDVGFEQLTTNAICERAGLTPPALYRYFPNKYAILKVLGERLMAAQDAVVGAWWLQGQGPEQSSPEIIIERIADLQRGIIAATVAFPGGTAINRAVRAVPILQRLHVASRDRIAEQIFVALRDRYATVPESRLHVASRMVAELSSALTGMVIDEPNRDADLLTYEIGVLFSIYFRSLRETPPGNLPY